MAPALLGAAQRTQALRRLGLLVFAAFAVVLDPRPATCGTAWPELVGVGRGADLVLYALVVAFLGFVVTTYLRFRDMETRYTRLARRIALDEAARDYPRTGRSGGRGDGGDVLDEPGGRD